MKPVEVLVCVTSFFRLPNKREQTQKRLVMDTFSGQTLKTEIENQVIDLLREQGPFFRAGAQTLELQGDSKKFTKVTRDATASWTAENGAITPSDAGLDTLTMDSRALIMECKVSNS